MLTKIENKIIEDMPDAEYRAHPAVSQSDLKNLAKCPLYYKYKKENPCDSDILRIGRAVHVYILEPEKFEQQYFKIPKMTRRGKAWEEIQAKAAAENKEVIFDEELIDAQGMKESLMRHKTFVDLMKNSKKEVAMFWTDNDIGIECKGKMDGYSELYNMIYDVKTTRDCIAFRKQFFSLRYQIQAAFYLDAVHAITGIMPNGFMLYAVEKEPPYLSKVYMLDILKDEVLRIGRDEYKYLLNKYLECENKNNFDIAFENDVERIEYPPAWYNKLTAEEEF